MAISSNSKRQSKNPTPRQLAIYASLLIAIFLFGMMGLSYTFGWLQIQVIYIPIFSILIFGISYITILQVLDRYIYRKIKLIYKIISKSQADMNLQSDRMDLGADILSEVGDDVENWADSQAKEISELKKLEEYRRDFMGDISHELKTPIFNIQGYLHTLLDGALEDEKINRPYLKKAARNVERLHSIVQDLESISVLESEAAELDIQKFNIKDLSLQVYEELYIQAKDKNITLSFKKGSEVGYLVSADKEKISQVLVNLISNSIKYGKENGTTQIGFYDMDKVILIDVEDNGIGIAEQHLKRLFDRFYRVDKSRSRDAGGTGLGLAIVKHILEVHKQSISVRSTIGEGTTFSFTLNKA